MEKKKLLIVDDIPENLTILYKTLHDDYDIIGANNGPEALVLAQSAEPDLILLDIMMPGMNGFEVCRILKEQETLSPFLVKHRFVSWKFKYICPRQRKIVNKIKGWLLKS